MDKLVIDEKSELDNFAVWGTPESVMFRYIVSTTIKIPA